MTWLPAFVVIVVAFFGRVEAEKATVLCVPQKQDDYQRLASDDQVDGVWSEEYFCRGKYWTYVFDLQTPPAAAAALMTRFQERCLINHGPDFKWVQPHSLLHWYMFKSSDGTFYGHFAHLSRGVNMENPEFANGGAFTKQEWEEKHC